MIRTVLFLLFLALSMSTALSQTAGTDSNAVRRRIAEGDSLARRLYNAVGGDALWKNPAVNLQFDFVVEKGGAELSRFSHSWNRSTGEYHVSGKGGSGAVWRVDFANIESKVGTAYINNALAPDSLKERLQ